MAFYDKIHVLSSNAATYHTWHSLYCWHLNPQSPQNQLRICPLASHNPQHPRGYLQIAYNYKIVLLSVSYQLMLLSTKKNNFYHIKKVSSLFSSNYILTFNNFCYMFSIGWVFISYVYCNCTILQIVFWSPIVFLCQLFFLWFYVRKQSGIFA